MRDVFVLGAGMTAFGRHAERGVHELAAAAARLALADAGLSIWDVGFLASGNVLQAANMIGQRILQQIGQTGIPVVNTVNACATGSTAFREAFVAVGSGEFDIALAVGSERMGKSGPIGGRGSGESVEGVLGSGLMPAVFGQSGVEHMRQWGTTVEQFAKVAVKNHRHARHNPLAQYRNELSLEEVLAARMVAYPNTLYMCCPTGDGAAAALLGSEEAARRIRRRPVRVACSVLVSDPWTPRDLALPDVNTLTRNAAREAYERAAMGPDDLDLVELHDCFATAELLHWENLGLCREGDGGPASDDGRFALGGGRTAVNVSGGLLSKGHPLGATGIANICEIVVQLRGEAGARQVEGARAGLAQVIGLGSACTINILTV